LAACILVSTVPATALAGARAQPETAEGPAPAPDVEGARGPTVHLLNALPDDDVGVVKLARYHGSSAAAAGNAIVVTTRYEELCTEPCGVPVDVSERPIFFLVRDGNPVSYGFRLPESDEVTLKVKPMRRGLWTAGFMLTCFLILPAGIPMLVAGKPRVTIAEGAPSNDQRFARVKKAKT
jgi:hypothetical protein